MAALDIGSALTNIKDFIKTLSTWQSLCDVATDDEAARRIYIDGVSEEDESVAPCLIIDFRDLDTERRGNRFGGILNVNLLFFLVMPNEEQGEPETEMIWILTQLSSFLSQLTGGVNGSGGLMVQAINFPVKPKQIDPDENDGRNEWFAPVSLGISFI